jgi:hypothetical protein
MDLEGSDYRLGRVVAPSVSEYDGHSRMSVRDRAGSVDELESILSQLIETKMGVGTTTLVCNPVNGSHNVRLSVIFVECELCPHCSTVLDYGESGTLTTNVIGAHNVRHESLDLLEVPASNRTRSINDKDHVRALGVGASFLQFVGCLDVVIGI